MLNPLWLKTFQTLVETGHFTHTAEKLFMTQPGVSQHIKKLEQACGYPLIARHNKSFEVTEQGRQVYQYAKQRAKQETDLIASLSQDDAHRGEVAVSCSGALAQLIYPHLLDLQCEFAQLVVKLEVAPNRKIIDDLAEGRADLGLVTHIPLDPRIEAQEIGQETMCLIVPANVDEPITPELLLEIGLIRHPDAEHYLSLYFSQCGDKALAGIDIRALRTSGYINQLSQILLPVAKGLGFTVLPHSAFSSFTLRDQLAVHQPKKAVVETLYLVSKKQRAWPARFHTVVDKLTDVISL